MAKPRTLYDKIWDDHVVDVQPDGASLLYIDRHLVHEVTSPQAFEGLRMAKRKVRAPEKTLLVVDHNVPTTADARAPDEKTFAYLKDRPKAPKGAAWDEAVRYWKTLHTDEGAHFDSVVELDAANLPPIVTWGTSPEDVATIEGAVPRVEDGRDDQHKAKIKRALDYMGLNGGEKITDLKIDRAFIGSCTNGRIEDLRAAAKVVEGKKVAAHVNAMVVPGSGLVKDQAEAEGLDKIFVAAGFEWREPGCSMCLAMNPDKLAPGERCASTSNRNFEGRQGFKGRTHLVSPAMAAAAAIAGHFVDIRKWS